ncbi:MAG: efflux transporter outer membrane subunit [Sphingobacteriales bacterium]|nr:MAG: efflux transporter outer membrane subunit [Sphingobacteriales bacterium]
MKSYINSTAAALFALLLTACNVSKDVATPQDTTPEAFRNTAVTTDTASIADLPWKDFFADTSLQSLIGQALEHNYDMQIALKNIEAAQLLHRQVNWNYAPDLKLQIGASSSRPSDNSLNGLSASQFLGSHHIEDFTAGVGLSWEADIWGKIRSQKRSAVATYLQTREARNAIQTAIVSQVATGFYNLAMLDAQLEVARRNLALNDSTLRMMQLQFTAGQVTSLAIEQAEAQHLSAAQLIPRLEQNIGLQENAISVLAGAVPAAVARHQALQDIRLQDDMATGFPSSIVSRRPDVRASELSLTVANARVGVTKANMYPSLSITASGGVNSFRASNWFNIPASLFGLVAGNLVQPLLNKKQLKTQFEVAKIDRERSVLQFRQTVLQAVGEVSDAMVTVEKLREQHSIATRRVVTLQKAISNANMLFESGMANYLEVITAQSNVLQAELDIAAIRRDQLIAAVDLYRSLGGGWK